MNKNIYGSGDIYYDSEGNKFLAWVSDKWEELQYQDKNWQEVLEEVPIEEIERFLRKKKIQNIEREV